MITSGFFNSNNGDRKYDALQFSSIFDGIIRDGVFGTCGSAFAVTKNPNVPMVVDVAPGRAWFNHTWTLNDAIHSLTLGSSDPILNRIDAVVLEINNDENVRTNTIKIVEGEKFEGNPSRPELIHSEHINQYAIAYISVPAKSTDVDASKINNVVGTSETPLVTGLIQMVDITNLLTKYDSDIAAMEETQAAEFREWFQHLQNELDANQAANLQRQIDAGNQSHVRKENVKNTYDSIMSSTDQNDVTGAIGIKDVTTTLTNNINENVTNLINNNMNIINSRLTANDGLVFNFSTDGAGNYGYLRGDGAFVPFKKGGIAIASKHYSPVGVVNDTYTMPEDGYLYVGAHNVNSISRVVLKLNNVQVSDYSDDTSGEGGNYSSTRFLKGRKVNKGDKLNIYATNVSSGSHRVNYFVVLIGD